MPLYYNIHIFTIVSLEYTNCTSCIKSNNLDLIEQSITHVLEQEGYRRIKKPPLPENSQPLIQEMYSAYKFRFFLVIGLFVGNLGWTVIETSLEEIFCRRAKKTKVPRLSTLAKHSQCDSFHLRVGELFWGALLEASASGEVFASGDLDCYEIKDMQFYGEPILQRMGYPHFFILDVSEKLKEAGISKINYAAREKKLKELQKLCMRDDELSDKYRSERDILERGNFEIADRKIGELLVGKDNFWNYWYHGKHILHQAYTKQKKLERDGVRLLFFQSKSSRLNPTTPDFWSPITSQENYGKDWWKDIPW